MRVGSATLLERTSFVACDWASVSSMKSTLNFPSATENAEREAAVRLVSLHTPDHCAPKQARSVEPFKQGRTKCASSGSSPDPRDPEEDDRLFVLDVLRKSKMTRRNLAEAAKVEDFRAMNYWLRGKDISTDAVADAGRLVLEWAKRENARFNATDLRRSGTTASSDDGQCKRTRALNEDCDNAGGLTPRYLRVGAPLAGTPMTPTTIAFSPYIGNLKTRSPVPLSLFNTPIHGGSRSLDDDSHDTPSTISYSTSSTFLSGTGYPGESTPMRQFSFDDALFANVDLPKETPGIKMQPAESSMASSNKNVRRKLTMDIFST